MTISLSPNFNNHHKANGASLLLTFSSVQFSSVQSLIHVRFFATPRIAARQASLSITNSRSSLKLMSIESVMPASHLILCCPLLLLPPIPPSISLFQWVNFSHEVAKVLEFQLQHHSLQRIFLEQKALNRNFYKNKCSELEDGFKKTYSDSGRSYKKVGETKPMHVHQFIQQLITDCPLCARNPVWEIIHHQNKQNHCFQNIYIL